MSNPLKVVDLKNTDRESLISDLFEAAKTQGFLFVDGHDFSQREVDDLLRLSQSFFALPLSKKEQYPFKGNRGYSSLAGERLDLSVKSAGDPKEVFNFGDISFLTGEPNQVLPELFTEEKAYSLIKQTNIKLYNVVLDTLRLLALGLGIDEDAGGANWFDDKNKPDVKNGLILRFLKYPSQKLCESETTIRAGAHTDYGTVTALFQFEGQEGLELYTGGKWQAVPFIKSKYPGSAPPLIVNFGDQLSYWTAGVLKSTIHRVKFPEQSVKEGKDRYSIVFFSHPAEDTLLEPIPSDVVRAVKDRGANTGPVITAKEHLERKLKATFIKNPL